MAAIPLDCQSTSELPRSLEAGPTFWRLIGMLQPRPCRRRSFSGRSRGERLCVHHWGGAWFVAEVGLCGDAGCRHVHACMLLSCPRTHMYSPPRVGGSAGTLLRVPYAWWGCMPASRMLRPIVPRAIAAPDCSPRQGHWRITPVSECACSRVRILEF